MLWQHDAQQPIVHCRTGSSEMSRMGRELPLEVHCRTGSSEILGIDRSTVS